VIFFIYSNFYCFLLKKIQKKLQKDLGEIENFQEKNKKVEKI